MKQIGIKQADGSFYPIMEEDGSSKASINLTTAQNNQTSVHVDLYRSETGTLQDADYLSTLKIDNLRAHNSGEPTLDLDLAMDEDGLLHASVSDQETGASNSLQVSLIPSPPAGQIPLNTVQESAETKAEESNMISPGPNDEDFSFDALDEKTLQSESDGASPTPLDMPDFEFGNETPSETPAETTEDFSLPDLDDNTETGETASDDFSLPNLDDTTETGEASVDDFSLPDLDDNTETGETAPEDFSLPDLDDNTESGDATTDDFSLPDLDDTTETGEASAEEFSLPDLDDTTETGETISDDFSLPDLDDTTESGGATSDDFSLPDLDDTTETGETAPEDFSLPDLDDNTESGEATADDFSLPDLDDNTESGKASADDFSLPDLDDTTEIGEASADDFSLPDLDDTTESGGASADDFSLPDFGDDAAENSSADSDDLNFDLPDFSDDDAVTEAAPGSEDVFGSDFGNDFGDSQDENGAAAAFTPNSGMFDDLYDDTKSGRKRGRGILLFFLILIALLILAALMFLFVLPGRMNVRHKTKEPRPGTEILTPLPKIEVEPPELEPAPSISEPHIKDLPPAEPEREPELEPVVEDTESAREDEIVVVTTPVVPEPPAPPPVKPADIRYKIKWGDTLWDIANAYYKNPWRYHMLARYNGIKNPDYIVSGTWILIPAE
ncbi:MAG: LysM peptidoglycan-binding domain-containing protein [Treponema sp.]|nr:LysM peptidoglycan-binding domain-containing protein [Treponema sp.]